MLDSALVYSLMAEPVHSVELAVVLPPIESPVRFLYRLVLWLVRLRYLESLVHLVLTYYLHLIGPSLVQRFQCLLDL